MLFLYLGNDKLCHEHWGAYIFLNSCFWFFSDICLGVAFLDHTVVLFLVF